MSIDDIKHIRSMMERSSKFFSLSGMSGISAGLFALLGAFLAHCVHARWFTITGSVLYDLVVIAIFVLIGAVSLAVYFSAQKAKRTGAKFWMPVTRQVIKAVGIPLVVGGLFCFILIFQDCEKMIAATMLIFYGLALINVGDKTYSDIRILGTCEILLGFLAGIFVYNVLFFWALGFGVLHIVYGIVMYFKYDRNLDENN